MSDGELAITGYVYPTTYIPEHDKGWYNANNAPFENGAIKLSHEIITYVDDNPEGIVFDGRFDNYTNGTNDVGLGFEDGFFDMIVVVYRSGAAFTSLGTQSFNPTVDGFAPDPLFLGGLQVIDNYRSGSGVNSTGFSTLTATWTTAHELGHRQFGYYHECDAGCNDDRGQSDSVMEGSPSTVASMSGPDLVKLGWLHPDTLDAATFTHTSRMLDDAITAREALYIQNGSPAVGDVLIVNRGHSNFWDRPADGTNADGDNGDHFYVEEGLYIYKAGNANGGLGGSYSSMENTGEAVRNAHHTFRTFNTVSNVAYGPGDAYTPFSTYRHQFPSPRFNFYASSSLDDSFAITDIQQQGSEFTFNLWSNYLLDADNGDKLLSTVYNLDPDSTLGKNSTWNLGGVFRFEGGFEVDQRHDFYLDENARLELASQANVTGLTGNRITFGRLDPLEAWDRIYIDGANSLLRQVDIDGATVGIEVSAVNATIRQVSLTNNGKGILTDFVNGTPLQNLRSTLALELSTISSSTGVGLHLRHADATIDNTTISGSASHGMLIEDSDVVAFTNNTVTGNGTVFGHGITINSGGDLTMGPATGYGGNNVVMDNVNHETKVSTGGTMLVGTSGAGGDNSIYKSNNSPSGSGRYILNGESSYEMTIMAENTWWNLASGPPTGAFSGPVDSMPFLTCPPSDPPSCRSAGSSTFAARTEGNPETMRGADWHTWLRGEILAARLALATTPFAEGSAGTVYRLAHLQRLDRRDELSERAATMAQLETLRRLLVGTPPVSVRSVAEAALVAEVRAGLFEENYDATRELLAGYRSNATGENTALVLDLAGVSLLEQESDYVGALSQLRGVIAALPREASDLAAELELSASVIAEKAEEQAGGRVPSTSSAVASVIGETVTAYALEAAYPNPFNPSVAVPFAVPEVAHVKFELFDVLGRRVAVLANSLFDAGRHTVRFDGSRLASGVYLLRAVMEAEAGGTARAFTQRLTLLK